MTDLLMTKHTPSADDEYPPSLRSGRKRLIGLIDGYPSYYDAHAHRIEVLLERTDGSYRLTEYYRLRPDQTVAEYLETAERNGYECEVLADWVERRSKPERSAFGVAVREVRNRFERLLARR